MSWNLARIDFNSLGQCSNKSDVSVTQHQLTSPNVWKSFPNSPSTHTICLLQKMTFLDRRIYSWQGFNSLECPLMLRTNYRCVQAFNISVDVAQYVENFHKFTMNTLFLSATKMTFLNWTIYSWQGFNWFGCSLMVRTNHRCVQSLNISVDVVKCVENFH